MHFDRGFFAPGAVLIAIQACGGSTASNSTVVDAGLSDDREAAAVALSDAMSSSEGSNTNPSPEAGEGPYSGVVVAELDTNEGQRASLVNANFLPGSEQLAPPFFTDCDTDGGLPTCCPESFHTSLPGPGPGAGVVTVADGEAPVATLDTPSAMGTGAVQVSVAGSLWTPGDALAVTATGGEVAAFSGTLRTPNALANASLAIGSAAVAISRAKDLVVTWAPDGMPGEKLQILVSGTPSSMGAPSFIACTALDTAGSITVGASFLGMLPAGSAQVTLSRSVVEKVVVSNGSVALVGESQISGPATLD
jgi:hypothetical protein